RQAPAQKIRSRSARCRPTRHRLWPVNRRAFFGKPCRVFLAERILADAPQRLTPFVDELTKCGFAGAVADKSILIFQLNVIAQHLDSRQPSRTMSQSRCWAWGFSRHAG